jgi:type II secretory pathway pseudopilin PulG
VNPFVAVAIIIGVFFIAGLMVGFLIVMALPALVHRRGIERRRQRRRIERRRIERRRIDDSQRAQQAPPPWPGTGSRGADPDGDAGDAADDYDDPDDPPATPWWRDTR